MCSRRWHKIDPSGGALNNLSPQHLLAAPAFESSLQAVSGDTFANIWLVLVAARAQLMREHASTVRYISVFGRASHRVGHNCIPHIVEQMIANY